MGLNYFNVDDKKIPFYSYDFCGHMYHKYLRQHRNMYYPDGERIKEDFCRQVNEQFPKKSVFPIFNKATLFIIHFFEERNSLARDLDNLDYKPLIDAIRRTGTVPDDNWYHLSINLLGDIGDEEHIEAYLVPYGYTSVFMNRVLVNYYSDSLCQIMTNMEYMEDNQYRN